MRHAPWRLSCLLALAGCYEGLGPVPDGKQLSIIGSGTPSNVFPGVPDTVSAGPVTIRYNSYGSSSCNRPAGEDVDRFGTTIVTITAYDVYVPPNTACTADFGTYNRSVTVVLNQGEVQLRLRGVDLGQSSPAEIAKTVVVR